MRIASSDSVPVAILLILLSACSREVTGAGPLSSLSPGDSPVVTDAAQYRLESTSNGWRGRIEYAFTNRTDRTISLLNCRGGYTVTLEKQQGDDWVSAWSPVMLECLSPPIEIKPGASLNDALEISAGKRGSNTYPQFTVDEIDGVYRLAIERAYWDYDHNGPPWGQTVPVADRVSNAFEIRTSR